MAKKPLIGPRELKELQPPGRVLPERVYSCRECPFGEWQTVTCGRTRDNVITIQEEFIPDNCPLERPTIVVVGRIVP